MSHDETPQAIQAVLLDIEGTTTPIAFVVHTLFGYARAHLRDHIEQHAGSSEYATLFARLRDEHAADRLAGSDVLAWVDAPPPAELASIAEYANWQMDHDRKSTALKELQGKVWQEGYRRGELVAEVFADVPKALVRWRAQGLGVGVFSSGSVLAQQLLFRHSSAGDLTGFFQWYFDTTTGAKTDAESYQRIAREMGIPPARIVFVSDITRELDAASDAGMQTRLSIRPGNTPQPQSGHRVIRTFDQLAGEDGEEPLV